MESREIEKSRIVVAKAKKSASGVGDPLARWRKKDMFKIIYKIEIKLEVAIWIATSSFINYSCRIQNE